MSIDSSPQDPSGGPPPIDAVGLHLEVISGNGAGGTLLVEDELIIGRHAEGAGKLSDDSEISRQHARISREVTGDYAIEDLGSSNGTFVNGLRIMSPRLLDLSDSIEMGATTLVVRTIVGAPPAAAAAVDPPASGPGYAPTVFARSPAARPGPGAQETKTPTTEAPPPDQETPAPATKTPPPAQETEAPTAEAPPPEQATLPPTQPSAASGGPPRLALTLEVDYEAGEARIALGEGGETIRLVFEDQRWRARPSGD
ncbi:MAG TPA: FHA domain-containing protein [Vicinamibacteria bacterium]|jgi:pSer/pThr/pTyr-binding forkhead associated (FHA) protein|nr:FHA domain-containing protein [Vicinamibacteria bacterium]